MTNKELFTLSICVVLTIVFTGVLLVSFFGHPRGFGL